MHVLQLSTILVFSSLTDSRRTKRVVGGVEPSELGQTAVAILLRNRFLCSGTVLTNRWVISDRVAGDYNLKDIKVVAGLADLSLFYNQVYHQINNINQSVIARVKQVKLYPGKDKYGPALLELDRSLQISSNPKIGKAFLPSPGINYPGMIITVEGWGQQHESGPASQELLAVSFPIEEDQRCTSLYSDYKPSKMFCAGSPGYNTCLGDGGAGASLHGSEYDRPILLGVVSFGKGCDNPTVFTKIEFYLPWIADEISCNCLVLNENFVDNWTRNEDIEGNIKLVIKITRESFNGYNQTEKIKDLRFEISRQEIRTRENELSESCAAYGANENTSLRRRRSIPNAESRTTAQDHTYIINGRSISTNSSLEIASISDSVPKNQDYVEKTLTLLRWREYAITLTVINPTSNESATNVYKYDTYQWACEDPADSFISQVQFCNNSPDCPNARDEDPSVCIVSKLPRNLGFLVYLFAVGVITTYFFCRKSKKNMPVTEIIKSSFSLTEPLGDRLSQTISNNDFITEYKKLHEDNNLAKFCQHLKFWYYNNKDMKTQTEVFTNIQTAEESLHETPEEIYSCVLKNYGGDEAVTARVSNPKGSTVYLIRQSLRSCTTIALENVTQGHCYQIRRWLSLSILFSGIVLCSHLFDYIKDLDIVVILNHFDTVVIQRAYYQYHDFNMAYLTYTSISLLIFCHILSAIYWITLKNKPKITRRRKHENMFLKFLRTCIPCIPILLPILLFCRQMDLELQLNSLDLDKTENHEIWLGLMDENMIVHNHVVDVKIIEMVTESFGQLIITCLLIIRFPHLLEKDFQSFGIDFKSYIILTMVVSFLTMLRAIHRYHNRYRASLHPKTSLGTPFLVIIWTMLIVMKVVIYVVAFVNTPGLIFLPFLVKISVSFCLFQSLVEDFKKKEIHDKYIYLLISFLIPISLPSKELKTMKLLNILNFFLYFLECFFLLIFAFLTKHFYHNKLYCQFYEIFPQKFFANTSFDFLLLMVCGALFFVTLISSLLLGIHAKYFHPRTRLFGRNK